MAHPAACVLQTRARECVTRLQSGDEAILAAWRRICEASRREFEAIYKRLDVQLQVRDGAVTWRLMHPDSTGTARLCWQRLLPSALVCSCCRHSLQQALPLNCLSGFSMNVGSLGTTTSFRPAGHACF